MKFEIDFNRGSDDKTLEAIGAKLEPIPGATKYPPFDRYMIELNTFEELEALLKEVDFITGVYYSAIISFDSPTIFLDNNV